MPSVMESSSDIATNGPAGYRLAVPDPMRAIAGTLALIPHLAP